MTSASPALDVTRTSVTACLAFLPDLIPGVLQHQLKRRLFLYEALDLLFHLPPKALSVPPPGRRICSPEPRNAATLFLHFRPTRCVPAADSWTNLFPVT